MTVICDAVVLSQAPSIRKWFTTFSARWWTTTKSQWSVTTSITLCRRRPTPWLVGPRTSPYSTRSSSLKNSCSSLGPNIFNESLFESRSHHQPRPRSLPVWSTGGGIETPKFIDDYTANGKPRNCHGTNGERENLEEWLKWNKKNLVNRPMLQ